MSAAIDPARLALGRNLAGLTESQAAKLTGLSRTAVVLSEMGTRILSDAEAERVAEVYDVRPDWLRGDSQPHPEAEQFAANLSASDAHRLLLVLDSMRSQ